MSGWWIVAFMACCVQLLQSPESDVFLIETATVYADSSAATAVWNIPLVGQNTLDQGLIVPEWFAAALAAALIVCMLNRSSNYQRFHNIILIILLAAAWSPDDILLWFWVLLTVRCLPHQSDGQWTWKSTLLATTCVAAAILTTLDFSIVILLTFTIAIDSIIRQRRASKTASSGNPFVCIGVISAVSLGLTFSFDGFSETAYRPLTAILMVLKETPYSSLHTVSHSLLDSAVLATVILVALNRTYSRQHSAQPALTTITVFLAAGLLCREYVFVAIVVLMQISPTRKNHQVTTEPTSNSLFINGLTTAATIGVVVLQILQLQPLLSSDPLRQRLVDLSSLKSKVNVLIINPESTPRWKGAIAPRNTRLIIDDRWERFSPNQAEDAQQVFADLLRGRREKYLLANTKAGGTRKWMGDLNPDLLVVNSNQWTAIRQLSLDPNWNVIAIDGHRTVLAAAGRPELDTRAQEASRLWFFLEWPNPRSKVVVEGILEPGLDADSIRVAGVLNAMRLPYAALRVLPDIDSIECDLQRAWSYTELAIRSARQNGQTSLLDVVRARQILNRLQSHRLQSSSHQQHLTRIQEALDRSIALTSNSLSSDQETTNLETSVLYSISTRQYDEVAAMRLQDVTDHRTQMMIWMLRGLKSKDLTWTDSLQNLADSPDCPAELSLEILFTLGCISLEDRRIDEAIGYFRKTLLQAGPERSNKLISLSLCRLYLFQLSQ